MFISFHISNAKKVIDLTILGFPNRIFSNASYGLQHSYQNFHQCSSNPTSSSSSEANSNQNQEKSNYMKFTPNRKVQLDTWREADHQKLQNAVILAVGGHSNSYYNYGEGGSINGLMAVWDSWIEYFFSQTSNTTSLILLFDERDFLKQNYTTSKQVYLDHILIKNMGAERVDCVEYRNATHKFHHFDSEHHTNNANHIRKRTNPNSNTANPGASISGVNSASSQTHSSTSHSTIPHTPGLTCSSNHLFLDQGYHVYYFDFDTLNTTTSISSHQKPLIIFTAIHHFPRPDWSSELNEDELFDNWKPSRLNRRYPTNYGYVKMTNWYAYHMLNLQLLDFFDYAMKLDNDVFFMKAFPEPNLPRKLAYQETYMMSTDAGWYQDDPRISQGVRDCLWNFVDQEAKVCGKDYQLKPGGIDNPTFWETTYNTTFRAHLLVYWLGLYTSPETYSLAKHWNSWPRGMWDYRWGDQQWWPRPIAMFGSGNLHKEIIHYVNISTDNREYVDHKLWPRWGTIPKTRYFNFTHGTTKSQRDELYRIASKAFIY